MTMLSHHRRYLGVVVLVILALLLAANFVPDPLGRGVWRGRSRPPANEAQRLLWKVQDFSLYVQDNFGFRASLPALRRTVRAALDAPNDRNIYEGSNGHLFWGRENTPAQSSGDLVRAEAVERFVAMAKALQDELAPQGGRVVVAIPPNAQSVELRDLPDWQKDFTPRPTEYDLLLAGLKADGIAAVDLRKVLREAPFTGPRYMRSDTHWTFASSVYAFNAALRAGGHPDWTVDPKVVIGPLEPAPPGDLVRTSRNARPVHDQNFVPRFQPPDAPIERSPVLRAPHEHPAFRPYVQRFRPEGPRVLIIGDSFTIGTWTRLFAGTPVAEAGWMHFSRRTLGYCGFDAADVKDFKPDLVILARTERLFPCLDDAWPDHLPEP